MILLGMCRMDLRFLACRPIEDGLVWIVRAQSGFILENFSSGIVSLMAGEGI
jgi:hypothetical protein